MNGRVIRTSDKRFAAKQYQEKSGVPSYLEDTP